MKNRIVSLRVKNFKCFDTSRFYEFRIDNTRNPVILSGPNGFGKTTFFDAIELLFSRQITRFTKGIERSNTDLGKNILLNQVDVDGYIVLTLKNEHDIYTTLFAKIQKDYHSIQVENSLMFGLYEGEISNDSLERFLEDYRGWSETLNTTIRFKKDFNVYYYVSQAESVHFLKKTIADRKDTINVLLNTESVDSKINRIVGLIGRKSDAQGVLINDEIRKVDEQINEQLKKIKELSANVTGEVGEKRNYINFHLYEADPSTFEWDNPNISNASINAIKDARDEVKRLILFMDNYEDYQRYCGNEEIRKINNYEVIDDYNTLLECLRGNDVTLENIIEDSNKLDKSIQIYNSAKDFLEEKKEPGIYTEAKVGALKEIVPDVRNFDFALLLHLADEIDDLRKRISDNGAVITRLSDARTSLQEAQGNYNLYNDTFVDRCPFCNTKFASKKQLSEGFDVVTQMLDEQVGDMGRRADRKKEELLVEVKKVKSIVEEALDRLGFPGIDRALYILQVEKSFLNNGGRLRNALTLRKYIIEQPSLNQSIKLMPSDINRVLTNAAAKIVNPDYEEIHDEYQFAIISSQYGKENLELLKQKASSQALEVKKRYLEYLIAEAENEKLSECKKDLKKLLIKQRKLESVRKNLDMLRTKYNGALTNYTKQTMEKLRVPLLIYTGKILQDYQSGLGVFVGKTDMRFCSIGSSKQDILNTFSSGQLSAFVIAFMFAMNKQYISEKDDDLGFILIDDPVQTMDDINIASLIEVMRNEFKDKQIILSTHERDKENYILYKFYKHGLLGQSFNVKEELYSD